AVSGAGPVTVTRAFPAARNVLAYVRALDNDSLLGPAGAVRLIVSAGVLPEANFTEDTISGFTLDSIAIPVRWSDTQAYGGKTPAVEMLYFNWFGNSASLNDSVSVAALADSTTVFKVFWLVLPDGMAYVRARDNDGNLSPLDSMRLTVDLGRPHLDSASASADTIALGDSVAFFASAHDTNAAAIRDFVWNVNGGTDTITAAGVLRLLFMSEGTQTVTVRARDSDWVFSQPPDTLRVTVIDRAGPEIEFFSHHDGDTVENASSVITLWVRTRDPSGIYNLFVNNNPATRLDTNAYPAWQTWQMVVTLTEGINPLVAWSWDRSAGSNQTRDSIRIFYRRPDATPPNIVFSSPQPGDTLRDTLAPAPVNVRVNVTDQSGVAWVRCNDTLMARVSGNNYALDVSLAEGANALVVTAQDVSGNGAADTLPVVYLVLRDSTPPAIAIASPPAMKQIPVDSVTVVVYASDTSGPIRSGIASVTVNGVAAAFNSGHYLAAVPLAYGFNTLRAVAEDSSGNTAADSVVVIRNIPPVFVPNLPVKDTTLWLDSTSAIALRGSDSEGGSLTFEFVTWPALDTGTAVIVPEGTDSAVIAGYTPVNAGLDTFRVRVIDSLGGSDTLLISVTVIEKPTTKPYFTISTLPDTAILDSLYQVLLTAEDPQSLPLAFSLDYSVTPAAVTVDGASGLLTWTTAGTADTTVTIRAIVSNTIPESDTLEWQLHVVLRNLSPVLDTMNDTTVYEGQDLQFTVTASDTNGDSLFYSFGASYPAGATLDSVTGVFAWTPGYKQSGVYPVVLRVTERFRNPALSDSFTINITVRDTNNAPVIVDPGNKTVAEEKPLAFTLRASDINGDSVGFSATGLPAGALFDGAIGQFEWVPDFSQAGVYPVVFIATDNGVPPLADSAFDTITVIDTTVPVFRPDSLNPPPLDTVLVGYPYITRVRADDSTQDRMSYRKLIGPASLEVNDSLGIIGWVPDTAGYQEIVPVSVVAEDHAGNSDTLSWLILVARWPRIFLNYPPNPLSNDTGFSVIQMADGGYAVSGTIASVDSPVTWSVGFFLRTDSSGNPITAPASYPGTAGRFSLYSMQQTRDGGFIMCGTDVAGGVAKLALLKTNEFGGVEWLNLYSDIHGTYPHSAGKSVCVASDGGFVACGAAVRSSVALEAPYDGYAIKTDPLGALQWQHIYQNGQSASRLENVRETEDGGFVMCGEIREGMLNSATNMYVVRTLPRLGDTLWTRVYSRAGGSEFAFSILPVPGTPEYIVGGMVMAGNINNGVLMKVLEGGDTLWVVPLPLNTGVTCVRQTLEGDFVAGGTGFDGSGPGSAAGADVMVCRFLTSGEIEWIRFHGAGLNDGSYCVAPTADGGFVAAGFATTIIGGLSTDIFLAKVSREGLLEMVFGGIH
ncbi:MAG: putative Ig domain-containing protein, partial [Chitinispirillaceae bacterium]|nr:putative Ig domain-containing protein [Chitinispirillaceae bacterium]